MYVNCINGSQKQPQNNKIGTMERKIKDDWLGAEIAIFWLGTRKRYGKKYVEIAE